ncbi:ATP-binding protein [Nocardioides cynanchi]|uniref:ATP-binding protein n=1 Tax=Nocardioides cynanchi TaxID=2558918 RepID=UPI001245BA93|nr:BTAD domain-containing putative transcriptional regulator [Nocardioides cynanchi]
MTIRLRLLGEVSYDGRPVAGGRLADLLAALAQQRAGAADHRLVAEIWGDEPPAAPGKALQVLVSRLRTQVGAEVVARYDGGYRLALADDAVDVRVLERLVRDAARSLADGDAGEALVWADAASGLVASIGEIGGDGPLGDLRRSAAAHAPGLDRLRALALGRSGRDSTAVDLLRQVHATDPDDVEVLEALLRSEATAVGVPAALERYDSYRRDLADRLGVDPDAALRRVHRELLASDAPVRTGVRYEADELLGREADLAGLRVLVRTGRLTTILGPGGLGKTRTAHVLAREATQPRVHFVELVGISASEDVVSEVGTALGVRNSVTGRRTLTPAQLADVRGRIAQELDTVPTLLVLDNCEHVLDAAASLVAFLLATTRDLRIVTTSRAPLGIAAERVFLLSQLAPVDGAELFRRRARAVRPDVDLPAEAVDDVVARLDGLPLAVELAAARIRTMSVDEVRRALADRFTLLRGHDRSAPARHQTLTAVIGWSWDLLAPAEQQALAWLSVFHDGFSADAACVVLGPDGPDRVAALVDQSLLTVSEHDGVTRYRMLETVREFGTQRLAEQQATEEARAAQTRWALGLATQVRPEVFGSRQIEAMDLLSAEEGNLTDVLRRCLLAGDPAHAVPLLAAQGALWAITGNHPRFFALADLAERVVTDWDPPPELVQVTLEAVGLLVVHIGFLRPDGVDELTAMMQRLGPCEQPWTRVIQALFAADVPPAGRVAAALALADDPDPRTALTAWQWAAVLAENQGETDAARTYVEKALDRVTEAATPWQVATLHAQLAMLCFNAGRHHEAVEHARVAVPLLERLHSDEDALSMRTSHALAALEDGDLDEADRLLAASGEPRPTDLTGGVVQQQVRAELLLARGEVAAALDAWAGSVESMRAMRFAGVETNGLEPWVAVALGTALTAHVRHAPSAAQEERTAVLTGEAVRVLTGLLSGPEGALDYPVAGMLVAALGARVLDTATSSEERDAGVRLLAQALAFGYNRWFPVLAWPPLRDRAELAAPGRLAELAEEYAARRGAELHAEVLGALTGAGLTSSG